VVDDDMRLLRTSALLLALACGCKQEVLCHALGDCGGPLPLGIDGKSDATWVLAPGHGSCIEDLYVPVTDPRLPMGTKTTTGTPYPEPALFDWCDNLVAGPGAGDLIKKRQPVFFYESGPIGIATVKFHADGSFSTGISRIATVAIYFPSYCTRAFGAMDGMIDPMSGQAYPNVCKQLEPPLYTSGTGEGAFFNLVCDPNNDQVRADLEMKGIRLDVPADPLGCICRYDVDETGGPSGTFRQLDENTLIDFPDAVGSNYYQKTTYCHQGDDLQLTGANGAYLFDQRGLRTMDLVRQCRMENNGAECASGKCGDFDTAGFGHCQ
jgi:hypothetical protein